MGIAYVKVFLDWDEDTENLEDAEKGRLIDALVAYAKGKDPSTFLSGGEKVLFPSFKKKIDRDRSDYESRSKTNRENGSKGGRPKTKKYPTETEKTQSVFEKPNESENTQSVFEKPNESEKTQEKRKKNKDDYDNDVTYTNSLELYATTAFPHITTYNLRELVSFLDELPEDLIRYAIDRTSTRGITAYEYCRKILNNYVADNIKSVADAEARDREIEQRRKEQAQPTKTASDDFWARTKFY